MHEGLYVINLIDHRGRTLATLRLGVIPHTGERRLRIDQAGAVIGIPVDAIGTVADQLHDLGEELARIEEAKRASNHA